MLHPGDILYVPDPEPKWGVLNKGTTNTYTVKVPKTKIQIGFKDDDGPYANEPFAVEGLGAPQSGTADGSGVVTVDVPVYVREIRIAFLSRGIVCPVSVGDLDPIEEPSGVRKRLQHLGYTRGALFADLFASSDQELETQDRAAILVFQKAKGLNPTGVIDDATREALAKEHEF
jgi:hypothetical protein